MRCSQHGGLLGMCRIVAFAPEERLLQLVSFLVDFLLETCLRRSLPRRW